MFHKPSPSPPQLLLLSSLLLLQLLHLLSAAALPAEGKATPKPGFVQRLKGLDEAKKENALKLEIFDAKDVQSLSRWYCMISGVDTEAPGNATYLLLRQESCNDDRNKKEKEEMDDHVMISMCDALEQAEGNLEICIPQISLAECLAVYMYTSEFYAGYNRDIRSGKWEPYKVFTALLYSALVKIDRANPVHNGTYLYRGLDKEFTVDSSGRFYFKQFVSTTLDKEVAEMFGTGTVIVIVPTVPIIAAKLEDMSKYPGEEEVLISPFEAFEFINKTGNVLYFKSARSQDFLDNPNLVCPDDGAIVKAKAKQDPEISIKFGTEAMPTTATSQQKKKEVVKVTFKLSAAAVHPPMGRQWQVLSALLVAAIVFSFCRFY